MSVKRIKLYYYYPIIEFNNKSKILNLAPILEELNKMGIEERVFDIGEENIQLKRICLDEESKLWNLCFLRNKTDAPFKSKLDDEGEAIPLDDDEFIGEEVCAIYDENSKIICIQNNRYSISYNGISSFFISFMDKNTFNKFYLSPLTYSEKYTQISDDDNIKYKSIVLGFTDIRKIMELATEEQMNDIEKIVELSDSVSALNGKIELSVGRSKTNFLDKIGMKKLVNFFKKHKKVTKTLKVKMLDDDTIRVIDLINYKVDDLITINVSKDDPKTFDKILNQMENAFIVSLKETLKDVPCKFVKNNIS